MANLNTLASISQAGNTGKQAAAFQPKNIIGAILTPKGYVLTAAKIAALQTALQADALAASKLNRIFPVFGFVTAQDSSEDITVQTHGYGAKHVVHEGFIDWKYEYVDGQTSLHKNLRMFNGSAHDFLFVDSANMIIGTNTVDSTGSPALKAIPCDGGFFYAHPWKANDGSKIAQYLLQFVFQPKFINEYLGFVDAGFDLASNITGIVDVVLSSPSANATSGSYNVVAKTADVNTNLADVYPTELAAAAAWSATGTAGASIPVTGVAYNAAIGGFTLVLDKTSANYPSTAGAKVTISLVSPSALAALGVTNYESTSVAIVKN
jgi:hypothetical protein